MNTLSVNAVLKNFCFLCEGDIIVDFVVIYFVLSVPIILSMAIILVRPKKNTSDIANFAIRKYKNLLENGLKCLKYINKKMHRRTV